jgi:hypothetical protein
LRTLARGIPILVQTTQKARHSRLIRQQGLNVVGILGGSQPPIHNINANPPLLEVTQQCLPCKQVHQRRQRAPLPHACATLVEWAAEAVDHRTAVGVGQQQAHPLHKTLTHPQGVSSTVEKFPRQRVIGFPEVNEGSQRRAVSLPQQCRQQLQQANAVPNLPVLQECTLGRVNDAACHPQQAVGQDFG